ncbi:MAG: hypothetical protein ACE5KX_04350 [Acidimicrobiia bacterium]
MLAIVLVAVAVIAFAAEFRSERRATREYLDVARDVVHSEVALAADFKGLITGLEDMERTVVVELLDNLDAEANRLVADLELASAPGGTAGEAHVFLSVAVASWRDGLVTLKEGMLAVGEDPFDPAVSAMLARAFLNVGLGDRAYEGFELAVSNLDEALVGNPFPTVEFIPDEEVLLFEAGDLVSRLRRTPALGVRHDLTVADVSLNPRPVGELNGVPLVPLSESLDAEVTVSNRGNVEEEGITVQLRLVSSGDAFQVEQSVDMLAPGDLMTLMFAELPVVPGQVYELIVELSGMDDDDPENNIHRFLFIMNEDV